MIPRSRVLFVHRFVSLNEKFVQKVLHSADFAGQQSHMRSISLKNAFFDYVMDTESDQSHMRLIILHPPALINLKSSKTPFLEGQKYTKNTAK